MVIGSSRGYCVKRSFEIRAGDGRAALLEGETLSPAATFSMSKTL